MVSRLLPKNFALLTIYRIPPNITFEVDDCESEWTFDPLNFIYIRLAFVYLQPRIIQHAFEKLCAGGYLELQDTVFPFQSDNPSFLQSTMAEWGDLLVKAAGDLGRDWRYATKYHGYLEQAGFVDCHERSYKWPIGAWEEGEHLRLVRERCLAMVEGWLESLSMACLTRSGTLTPGQVEMLLVRVRAELRTAHKLRAYIVM